MDASRVFLTIPSINQNSANIASGSIANTVNSHQVFRWCKTVVVALQKTQSVRRSHFIFNDNGRICRVNHFLKILILSSSVQYYDIRVLSMYAPYKTHYESKMHSHICLPSVHASQNAAKLGQCIFNNILCWIYSSVYIAASVERLHCDRTRLVMSSVLIS